MPKINESNYQPLMVHLSSVHQVLPDSIPNLLYLDLLLVGHLLECLCQRNAAIFFVKGFRLA
jgi:hypothetical protein